MVPKFTRAFLPDWYEVLKIIYFRLKGEELPILKTEWIEKFPDIEEDYRPSKKFTTHCEVVLLEYLEDQRKWPIAIGTSKSSCPQCHIWTSHLNSKRHGPEWSLPGIPLCQNRNRSRRTCSSEYGTGSVQRRLVQVIDDISDTLSTDWSGMCELLHSLLGVES